MYKIELLPSYEGKVINIQSEIIFENNTQLFFSDIGSILINYRSFTINENKIGIKMVTYFYEFV